MVKYQEVLHGSTSELYINISTGSGRSWSPRSKSK